MGACEWEIIRLIKEQANIPVFANGGIFNKEDVERCIIETGVDGVMSSEALLENPALFSGELPDLDEIAQEYLDIFRENDHKGHRRCLKPHFFKFLHEGMRQNTDIRRKLGQAKTLEDFQEVVSSMKERRKIVKKEDKFGWYYRHRNFKESETPNNTIIPTRTRMTELQQKKNSKEKLRVQVIGIQQKEKEHLDDCEKILGKREVPSKSLFSDEITQDSVHKKDVFSFN